MTTEITKLRRLPNGRTVSEAMNEAMTTEKKLLEKVLEWRLPNGRTVNEASVAEISEVINALHRVSGDKLQSADMSSRKIGDGCYEVTFKGKVIGEVRRHPKGRRWQAFDRRDRLIGFGGRPVPKFDLRHDAFDTRLAAGEALRYTVEDRIS